MVVNADRSIEEVQDEIRRIVDRFLRRRRGARKGEWHPAKGPM